MSGGVGSTGFAAEGFGFGSIGFVVGGAQGLMAVGVGGGGFAPDTGGDALFSGGSSSITCCVGSADGRDDGAGAIEREGDADGTPPFAVLLLACM